MSIRLGRVGLIILVLALTLSTGKAKEGVKATILTPISASTDAGAVVHVKWLLADEDDNKPFSACAVFIRLIGPTGEASEAFSECDREAGEGRYSAAPVVPAGGVGSIEIGIAGTMTDREGNSRRSDWLIPLANNPLAH